MLRRITIGIGAAALVVSSALYVGYRNAPIPIKGDCAPYMSLDIAIGDVTLQIPPNYDPTIGSYLWRDVQSGNSKGLSSDTLSLCPKAGHSPLAVGHVTFRVPTPRNGSDSWISFQLNRITSHDGPPTRMWFDLSKHDRKSSYLKRVLVEAYRSSESGQPLVIGFTNMRYRSVRVDVTIHQESYKALGLVPLIDFVENELDILSGRIKNKR
jgi:hypothetical protein